MSTRKVSTPRPPLPRDLAIYELVVYQGLTQEAVAQSWKLSQSMVSKICSRVRKYRALAVLPEQELWSKAEGADLARHELIAQKIHLRERAMKGVAWGEQGQTTTKEFERDDKGRVLKEVKTVSPRGDMRAIREADRLCEGIAELRGVCVRRGRGGERGMGRKADEVAAVVSPSSPTAEPGGHKSHIPSAEEFAIMRLKSVSEGRASLADVESRNFHASQSDGFVYPSYFEKCAENMNGVRVADWVREHVPEERLPHGEDLWLPAENSLADFDGAEREVIEVDTSERYYNPGQPAWRFGRKRVEGRGEESGGRGQETGNRGQMTEDRSEVTSFISPSPPLPVSPSPFTACGATHERGASTAAKCDRVELVVPPTRLERLLTSGRVRSGVARRVLERVVRQRRAK